MWEIEYIFSFFILPSGKHSIESLEWGAEFMSKYFWIESWVTEQHTATVRTKILGMGSLVAVHVGGKVEVSIDVFVGWLSTDFLWNSSVLLNVSFNVGNSL